MDLLSLRSEFEPYLRRFLLDKQASVQAYAQDARLRAWLAEPERLLFAGGKRVRPLLCLLGFLATGRSPDPAAFEAARALELFHLFALIHDDLMDRGRERHGVPTAHRRIAAAIQADGGRDAEHVGAAQAIIVGDLLFAWSVEALQRAHVPEPLRAEAFRLFFAMADEVMVGQMLDVDLTTRTATSSDEIRQKMLLKTAGYTFIKPLQIGIALGQGAPALHAFAEAFGEALGLAFQIQDDLSDAFATVEETGKTPLSDLRDHQHSLLTQGLLERGTDADRAALRAVWGMPEASPDAHEDLRRRLYACGAFSATVVACRQEAERARGTLAAASLPDDVRPLFEELFSRAVSLERLDVLEAVMHERYGR